MLKNTKQKRNKMPLKDITSMLLNNIQNGKNKSQTKTFDATQFNMKSAFDNECPSIAPYGIPVIRQ
jgi:hypothetical protein